MMPQFKNLILDSGLLVVLIETDVTRLDVLITGSYLVKK